MMEIRFANDGDPAGWMTLVQSVRDAFPGLETPEALAAHRDTVMEFIARREAICAVEKGRVVGALLFSRKENELCFLAVLPEFRRQHIAERMVALTLPELDPERDVTVTTYREGVPEGIAARAFYQRLGFREGALTEEFGSPVQQFVLKHRFVPAGTTVSPQKPELPF